MDKGYRHYSPEEFAEDERFWLWALQENNTQDTFWEQFIAENPEKAGAVAHAKMLVLQLNNDKYRLEDKNVNILWEKIRNSKEGLDAVDSNKVITERRITSE